MEVHSNDFPIDVSSLHIISIRALTSSERVGGEKEESCTSNHFDDTINSSGKQSSLWAFDAQVCEDGGCIVVDGVCSGHLLADHKSNRNEGSLSVGRNRPHLALEIHEASSANKSSLVFKLLAHLLQLHSDIWVVCGKVPKFGQDSGGFLPVV